MRRSLVITLLLGVAAQATAGPDPPPPPQEEAVEDAADAEPGEPLTGTVRLGAYRDSDRTSVYRFLATVAHGWGAWSLHGDVTVDAVTSASLDVRSSPLGMVDVVTTASGRTETSGGQMSDRRYQVTGGGGWTDGSGKTLDLTAVFAREADYTSVGARLTGSYDVLDRTTTLLGGVTFTRDWIASVLDPQLDERMIALGWSAGIARVVTPRDAIRLRYDGRLSDGYHASPYRNVRFGDWIANVDEHQITFTNTIGSADGLPEHEPERRLSHAVVLEWVHSLAPDIGLHPSLRGSHDSWGVDSAAASLELRIAKPRWRLQAGYRYYLQTRASFFEDKYTGDPAMYTYYTSDKDLGDQRGHLLRLSTAWVLSEPESSADSRMLLDLQLEAGRYAYPGFTLLPTRSSVFASLGITWEL